MQYYDQNGSNSGVPPATPAYPSQPVVPVQPVYPVQPVQPGSTAYPQHPAQAPYGTPVSVGGMPPTNPYGAPPNMPHTLDKQPKIPDRKSVATKMVEVVYLLTIILESALALRFVFKLLGGSSNNTFLSLLYNTTEVFTFPFQNLFGSSMQNSVRVSNYDLEFTTLVAVGIYALIAFIIVKIIDIFR